MILVTGATGLVGSYLLFHLLENEEKVRAIYRNSESLEKTRSFFKLQNKEIFFNSIEWIQADITDVPSLEKVFIGIKNVYHCAALISFDPKEEDQLRKTNIEGTANVVNFCLDFQIEKLCYVSSIAALGDLKEHENIVTEETEWNPEKSHSDYAISKYGAEMEVWRGQQEGLKVVIVNPGVILGFHTSEKGSNEIFLKVKNGLRFYTKGSTGFVSVVDVVKIMILLMNSEINGERFIVVSENQSYENLVKSIAISLNVKPPIFEVNSLMTSIFWKIDWVMANFFQQKRRMSKMMSESLHTKDIYSKHKTITVLKYQFQDIEETISETCKKLK
jgi:nucleoside-diphosphate-sugar epimerase